MIPNSLFQAPEIEDEPILLMNP